VETARPLSESEKFWLTVDMCSFISPISLGKAAGGVVQWGKGAWRWIRGRLLPRGASAADETARVGLKAAEGARAAGDETARAGAKAVGELSEIRRVHPRSLLSRQGAREMQQSKIRSMADAMKHGTFDWEAAGPIRVAVRETVYESS